MQHLCSMNSADGRETSTKAELAELHLAGQHCRHKRLQAPTEPWSAQCQVQRTAMFWEDVMDKNELEVGFHRVLTHPRT
jgi:hypothetical protein